MIITWGEMLQRPASDCHMEAVASIPCEIHFEYPRSCLNIASRKNSVTLNSSVFQQWHRRPRRAFFFREVVSGLIRTLKSLNLASN